jgi:hypothetical protein
MEQAWAVTSASAESGESVTVERRESRVQSRILGSPRRLALDSRLSSLDSTLALVSGLSSLDSVYAVVRVPSHGASATVISTCPGKSLLLGCAHAFEASALHSPIQLDVPAKSHRARPWAKCRLVDIDYQADLSLLELEDGPLDYVAPVAPERHIAGGHLLSVGYDEMQTPATIRSAHICALAGERIFTREKPWHGRSGGALLDPDSGYTVGVVQGYEVAPWGRGIYCSHQAIVKFLRGRGGQKTRQQRTVTEN